MDWKPASEPLPAHESPEADRLLMILDNGKILIGYVCRGGDVLTDHGMLRDLGWTIKWWLILPPLPLSEAI